MKRKLFAIMVGILVMLFSLYPIKFLTDFISWAINGFKEPTSWMTLVPNYLTSFLGAITVGWLARKRGWLFSLFLLITPQTALNPDSEKLFISLALINVSVLLIGGFIGEKMYEKFNQNVSFNKIKRPIISVLTGLFVAIVSTYPTRFFTGLIPESIVSNANAVIFNIPYFIGAITVGWLTRKHGWLYAYSLFLILLPRLLVDITYIKFAQFDFQQNIYFFSPYVLSIIFLPIGGLIGEKLYWGLRPANRP